MVAQALSLVLLILMVIWSVPFCIIVERRQYRERHFPPAAALPRDDYATPEGPGKC